MKAEIGDAILLYETVELGSSDAAAFFDAMSELPRLLAQPPLATTLSMRRMPPTLLAEVLAVLSGNREINARTDDLTVFLGDRCDRCRRCDRGPRIIRGDRVVPQIILGCPRDHELAIAMKKLNREAEWGATLPPLALAYNTTNRYAVWHEALHLLGAKECYELPNEGPTCEQKNCIMQYALDEHRTVNWPFLCCENLRRVQSHVAMLTAARRNQQGA